jgi:hypothetical protein
VPASKIVDEQEVLRWFAEGKTYQEMCDLYREKYNIETAPSLWGNFRRRRGLEPRIARDTDLIPWQHIKSEHRYAYPLVMLRLAAREEAGFPIPEVNRTRYDNWRKMLADNDFVVHYDPDTTEGWWYDKRRPGDGDGIVRHPAPSAARRGPVDA